MVGRESFRIVVAIVDIHLSGGEDSHDIDGFVEDDYLVIDPFFGSGQTGIAAAERNCRFIGYDISQSFCRLARRRLAEVY